MKLPVVNIDPFRCLSPLLAHALALARRLGLRLRLRLRLDLLRLVLVAGMLELAPEALGGGGGGSPPGAVPPLRAYGLRAAFFCA